MSNLADALETALDRREYPRISLVLPGQLSFASQTSKSVRVTSLSAGGAGLQFDDKPPSPEMVGLLAIEGFGEFNGITTRRRGDEGGLRFLIGEAERQHLLECLTVFVRSGLPSVRSLRESNQWPQTPLLTLTRQNGRRQECKVEDISLQGVMLLTDAAVPEGEYVLVGQVFGLVIPSEENHLAVQFLRRRAA